MRGSLASPTPGVHARTPERSRMKRITLSLAAALVVALAVAPVAAQAHPTGRFDPRAPQAHLLGPVVTNGDSAAMWVAYTCKAGNHLWVSLKQSADGKRDPRLAEEGSSQVAAAWLQSH